MSEVSVQEKLNYCFLPEFRYKHANPYHEKLKLFEEFVLRDDAAEKFKGKWSREIFQNNNPLEVEIGTGYGHFMHSHCQQNPNINFIGLDYRFKRSFELARRLAKIEKRNFRYLRAKGERLQYLFDQKEVDKIYYFFPDPWPKNKHHKKRLFQLPFLKSCFEVLKPEGELFIKTDHDDYFKWMKKITEQQDMFDIKFITDDLYRTNPGHFLACFQTKFEKIFLAQQIKIKAMVLKKKI